jgi:DNA-binding transcriptional LysR family regulator
MQWAERIGRRIKPRDLHLLSVVVEHGNIAKAAESLAVSRPVVSRTIADLERILGVPLFDRSVHGVEPTLYGRALAKRSVAIFDELRQGIREIEFLAHPGSGELSIGSTEAIAAGLLSAVIEQLSREHRKLVFKMELGNAAARLRLLRERQCELVVARQLQPEPDLTIEPLFRERLVVVAGSGNRWLGRRKIDLAALVDEPWIHAPLEIEPGGPSHAAFRARGLDVPCTIVSESVGFRYSMLASGRFLTMVPASLLHFAPKYIGLKALAVDIPRWKVPTSIITIRGRTLSPPAELFIAKTRELAGALHKSP